MASSATLLRSAAGSQLQAFTGQRTQKAETRAPAFSKAVYLRSANSFCGAVSALRSSDFNVLPNSKQCRKTATTRAEAVPKGPRKGSKGHIEETLLTPRFYTTNFDEMEQLFNKQLNPHLKDEQFVAMLQEMAADYNQTHFVRNENFKAAAEKLKGPTRKVFVEFLERSCTAEFSGFLLFKELGRRLNVRMLEEEDVAFYSLLQ